MDVKIGVERFRPVKQRRKAVGPGGRNGGKAGQDELLATERAEDGGLFRLSGGRFAVFSPRGRDGKRG